MENFEMTRATTTQSYHWGLNR